MLVIFVKNAERLKGILQQCRLLQQCQSDAKNLLVLSSSFLFDADAFSKIRPLSFSRIQWGVNVLYFHLWKHSILAFVLAFIFLHDLDIFHDAGAKWLDLWVWCVNLASWPIFLLHFHRRNCTSESKCVFG